jgi:tRNA modification GTPase
MAGQGFMSAGRSVHHMDDTIVALATPLGRGALAILRVSGNRAEEIVRPHVHPWPSRPREVTLARIRSANGELLDQSLVTWFEEGHSFTGEPMVEISSHGGIAVAPAVLAELITSGARQATPGEFTRRAVLNGRLDLIQAEGIADLVDARSGAMRRAALAQLDGGLSQRITELRSSLIEIEALIAYDIDFPEEDDGPVSLERIHRSIIDAQGRLGSLLATAPAGEVVRQGALVVLGGLPNTGKSSLFNALLGSKRAIVTDIPGTTRDAIEAVVETKQWPVRLVDTAGLRNTTDVVERLGVEVSERYLADALVVLACGDSADSVGAAISAIRPKTAGTVLAVRTKADLNLDSDAARIESEIGTMLIPVSAHTGAGISSLLEAIDGAVTSAVGVTPLDAPMLTHVRHRVLVDQARSELEAFAVALLRNSLPVTVAAVHLRSAVAALDEVIGTVDIEDVLDRLFSTFCVGK